MEKTLNPDCKDNFNFHSIGPGDTGDEIERAEEDRKWVLSVKFLGGTQTAEPESQKSTSVGQEQLNNFPCFSTREFYSS